jgi:hypothetical protein
MRRLLVVSVLLLCAANASVASVVTVLSPQSECLLCGPSCGGPCQLYYNSSLPVYELIVWIIPDEKGVIGGTLGIEYPGNIAMLSVTQNTLIVSSMGSLPSGVSFALSECQYSRFWAYNVAIIVLDASNGFISLCPHPDLGLTVMSCEPGYPVYPASGAGVWLGLNGTWATKSTSWGAIKSLFGE